MNARTRPSLLAAIVACFLTTTSIGTRAIAWEADSTHAGLTEQSALASKLHKWLVERVGLARGVYANLTIPPADAPALYAILKRMSPSHGYVPDASGRQGALSWLVAGAVLAEIPHEHALHHFFDPRTNSGLTDARKGGLAMRIAERIASVTSGPRVSPGGEPANTWWRSENNPLGYQGFVAQYRQAIVSPTPAERERHLAGALISAGAMLNVLQAMGSPSRVRDDLREHQQRIGNVASDRGSRFERIAALAFGRLGIPGPRSEVKIGKLADHFANPSRSGLADVVERSFFSLSTLPRATRVRRDEGSMAIRKRVQARLRRPEPGISGRLDTVAARNFDGATLRNGSGMCLARYHVVDGQLSFSIDDPCALEQLESILPLVASYGRSFLDALFSDAVSLAKETAGIRVSAPAGAQAALLVALAEAKDGTRTEYYRGNVTGAPSTIPAPPKSAAAVVILVEAKEDELVRLYTGRLSN